MRTERLFYKDFDQSECESKVLLRTEQEGRPAVVLDRTIFYPEGGGQPCDLGEIGGVTVVDVQEADGEIFHFLAGPLPDGDGPVLCRIDPARRRDHAEQHSGQHLLSAFILKLAGGRTVSFHLGKEYSTLDVDLPELSRRKADEIEDAVSDVVWQNRTIVVHECPPEKLSDFPLRRPPPQGEQALRIVDMDGLDYSACCGTHLPSTGRVGAFRILRAERYKGMTRVYFLAGERARLDSRRTAALSREAARILGCAEDEIVDRSAREIARVKELESLLGKARSERAQAEAMSFLKDAPKSGLLELPISDRSYDEILEGAKAVSEAAGRPAVAASRAALRVVVTAPDGSSRLGERLKPLLAGGKGGGGAMQFQAQFPNEAALRGFLEALRGAFV